MATASVGSTYSKKIEVIKEVPKTINLELSYDEAFALKTLFGSIGGTGYMRKHIDAVDAALKGFIIGNYEICYTLDAPQDGDDLGDILEETGSGLWSRELCTSEFDTIQRIITHYQFKNAE